MTTDATPRDGQEPEPVRGSGADGPTPRDVSETAMRAVVEIDAAIAGLQAMRTHLLAGIGHVAVDDALEERLDPAVGLRDAACELGLRQRRSDRTVEAELNAAMADTQRWPATVRAWGDTRIHRGHVAVIAEIGAPIQDPAAREAFEAALLPHAEQTTPGRLRAIARRELEQHLAEPLVERHRTAREQRGVWVSDLDDGMSMLRALLPTALAHGIHDRLTQMAKASVRARAGAPDRAADAADTPGNGADAVGEAPVGADGGRDRRTFDQLRADLLRADLLADLLLTADPTDTGLHGIRAEVSVLIPAPVLTGDNGDGEPMAGLEAAVARLANGAPLDPETARILAERASSWARLFTDPLTGQVLAVDSYTPSSQLKRLLRARDQHCRWPGCGQRARRCDIDHTKPWAEGGTTCHDNLAHLCRRHHTLKGAQLAHARRWKVRQTSPGVLEFTSPTGDVYTDEPPQTGPVFREHHDAYWGDTTGSGAPSRPF
ncbi:HNH endonuclease [Agrococcus carbonis]|uniref:HNH nuclease domain-containing protein n=1 Tax=Agrococcus carbonis TaxID=684552 RepID=A0A1H1LAM8_9MICO|nr:HNH endonuclease signature motif containing protein [Agrococcus carbonis]SDR71372.1 protein of unknown function [Agrococcus carbonis]